MKPHFYEDYNNEQYFKSDNQNYLKFKEEYYIEIIGRPINKKYFEKTSKVYVKTVVNVTVF